MARAAAMTCVLLLSGTVAQAAVDAFVPTSDAAVVETLRARPLERADVAFRQRRAQLRARPTDPEVALSVAQQAIALARRDGDPRYLGYAQAALAPWWTDRTAPVGLRLAKATILQSVHRFDEALAELDAVLAARPDDAQAWLTRASNLQVQGQLVDAASSCAHLREIGAEPYGTACLAELGSLSVHVSPSGAGDAGRARAETARAQLEQLIARSRDGGPGAVAWLQLMLAELSERLGDTRAAERAFRRALAGQADAYTKGAFADFLLDQRRPAEVIALLEGEERNDALLLRLAIARSQLGSPDAGRDVTTLQARFAAARLRNDRVHQREEARFELQLRQRADLALPLALANWAAQKEPADALLLIDAARAAGDAAAAEPARRFLDEHRPFDVRLQGSRGS